MAISHLDRETASPVLFTVTVLAIQILGIAAMVLTGIWMNHYLSGFAWDGIEREFDYHPLCMVISLVFLYSEGRSFTCFSMFQYTASTAWKCMCAVTEIMAVTARFIRRTVYEPKQLS